MTVCAWCGDGISLALPLTRRRPSASQPRVSHGICRSCVQKQLAALGRPGLAPNPA